MLECAAADYHVSDLGQNDQPLSVTGCFVVQPEIFDCGTGNSLLSHPGVEVGKHDFYVAARRALIEEGMFGRVALLFRQGAGANKQVARPVVNDSTWRRSLSSTTNPTPNSYSFT